MALPAVTIGAGDEDVGVEKGVVFLYEQLHVRGEHAVGVAAQVVAQSHKHITCNGDLGLRGACHRKHLAVVVLVFVALLGFPV